MAEQYTYDGPTIKIDGSQVDASPSKDGAYDSNGQIATGAFPATIPFFKDTQTFSPALAQLGTTKILGRDTNVASRLGTMSKGEKMWIFGACAFVDAPNVSLDSANGKVFLDQVRRYYGLSYFEWSFTGKVFMRRQMRAVPLFAPKITHYSQGTAADGAAVSISSSIDSMLDLRIAGKPYALESQEETSVNMNCQATTALGTFTLETVFTWQFEGIRLTGQKS